MSTRDDTISGTIKIGWTVRERDMMSAAQKKSDHVWTGDEMRAFAERLEELIKAGIPDHIDIGIDGENKPFARVWYDCGTAISEIEVDDGFEEIMGTLGEINDRASEADADAEIADQ